MFSLRRSKTQDPPWPSLYRGANLVVDGIGSCVVESHVRGTTYRVSDSDGNFHHVMPTPIFVWNKVQTTDGGTNENGSGDGPG
jgi:hypothetical protein